MSPLLVLPAVLAGFTNYLVSSVSVCSVSSCHWMMIRSDLCVEHKNITGLSKSMAKLMFGNINWYFLQQKIEITDLKPFFICWKYYYFNNLGHRFRIICICRPQTAKSTGQAVFSVYLLSFDSCKKVFFQLCFLIIVVCFADWDLHVLFARPSMALVICRAENTLKSPSEVFWRYIIWCLLFRLPQTHVARVQTAQESFIIEIMLWDRKPWSIRHALVVPQWETPTKTRVWGRLPGHSRVISIC